MRCAYLEFLQQNIETLELLTKWLKGQLHLFVPGKGESLQLILMVQREHLNQDPFGLQSANCKTDTKNITFLLATPPFSRNTATTCVPTAIIGPQRPTEGVLW